jgi:hypothetical protein
MIDNMIEAMKVVTISGFLLSLFSFFPFENFRNPQKNLFYMSCMFLISFHLHLFALLDRKRTHQKDLTNILFNFSSISLSSC